MKRGLITLLVFVLSFFPSFVNAEIKSTTATVMSASVMIQGHGRLAFRFKLDNVDEPVWLTTLPRHEDRVMDMVLYAYNRKEKVLISYDDSDNTLLTIRIP